MAALRVWAAFDKRSGVQEQRTARNRQALYITQAVWQQANRHALYITQVVYPTKKRDTRMGVGRGLMPSAQLINVALVVGVKLSGHHHELAR
jgi:hypothetical protein